MFFPPILLVRAVEVVGAGIVGSYVSWKLGERGWSVVLRDHSKKPWRNVCTGLVSANAIKAFPFLEEYVKNVIHGARIHAGDVELFIERRSVAYVLDRIALGKELLERAEASGVHVLLGERGPAGDGMVLVGADGVLSQVRRNLGLGTPRYVMGVQVTVKGTFDDYVDVYFLPGCDFFGWVVPEDHERARVGVASSGDPRPFLKKILRILGRKSTRHLAGRPIPVDHPLRRVVYGTTTLVGDSVPHTKATTGGGIYYGLLAARALADAIHKFFSTGTLADYQRFHANNLYPRLALHALIRRWLLGRDMEDTLRKAKDAGIEDVFSRYGDMDDPLFILNPRVWWTIVRIFYPLPYTLRRRRRSPENPSRARVSGRK